MVLAWYTYVPNIRICVTFLTIISITDLPDIKVIYFLFSCADAEDSSSSEPDDDGGGGAPSASPPPSQPSRASPRPDSPGHGHPDEHPDENADEDLPYMSDDGPEYECEGLCTMSSHLAKLDSLSARGSRCADKFFQVHTARWGESMPRPGDLLHSARAGGADVRELRKRKAENITRITAESHAFCTSSNLSQRRSDAVLETFTNVSTFKFKLCLKFCLHALCNDDFVSALASSRGRPISFVSDFKQGGA
jgi:hypothetical protein